MSARSVRARTAKEFWMLVETKPFFLTSEFFIFAIASISLLVSSAVDDSIDAYRFWLIEAAMVIGYLLSRGFAKSGSRTPSYDPRDEEMAKRGGDRR